MVDLYMCVYVVKMISIYLFMPFVIYSYVCIFFVIHILKSKANVSEYQIPNATTVVLYLRRKPLLSFENPV